MLPWTVTPVSSGVFRDAAVVFDIELLLRAGGVLAFDDVVRGCPDTVDVALVHAVGFEGIVGAPDDGVLPLAVFDGEDCGEFVVEDVDSGDGGGEPGLAGVGEEEDGLGDVGDEVVGEAEVVFKEVDDGVFAGDVGGGDDRVFGPVDRWGRR